MVKQDVKTKAEVRAEVTAFFREKNRRRKEGKTNGTVGQRIAAKQNRKMVQGAFGRAITLFQQEALWGTTGQVSENADAQVDAPKVRKKKK